jgi:hypothetical protein
MKKVQIGKCLYNVVGPDDYKENGSYNPRFTAIQCNGGQTVLPVNSRVTDTSTGIYFYPGNGMVAKVIKPNPGSEADFSCENIIDYSQAKTISDIIHNNEIIRDIQNDIITTSDNVLKLNISDNDTPEMKALKNAINAKGVDKKQYEDRFDQFQNDMRLLKGNSITLGKLISICSAFDISAELTLKDKEGVPNPIGQEFVVDLTEERDGGK